MDCVADTPAASILGGFQFPVKHSGWVTLRRSTSFEPILKPCNIVQLISRDAATRTRPRPSVPSVHGHSPEALEPKPVEASPKVPRNVSQRGR